MRFRAAIMSNSKRTAKNGSKKHNDYSLQLTRWSLKLIGAWPQIHIASPIWQIFVLLQIVICSSLSLSIIVPCFLYMLFDEDNIKIKLGAMGPLLHRIMGTINYWVLLKRSDEIRKLIQHMEADWNLIQKIDDREVMLQYAKFGRFIALICGVIMHGGIFLFCLAKLMKTKTFMVGNETFTMRPMTCPIYNKIIDIRFSPVNEIALVVQFVSTFIVSLSTVGSCSLAAVFAMHARGQLNVLYTWLNKLVENQKENHQTAEQKLGVIVEHHLRVLSFLTHVENIMNKISLVELMGCTINLCLCGYYILTGLEDIDTAKLTSYVNVYLSMAFNIFIFCYIGEIITEQCKQVGEMAYMTNWYNLHHKTALSLVLIIIRSSNVIKFTAGKLFQLSIATFGDVIRTSMVYLNLLRTLTM